MKKQSMICRLYLHTFWAGLSLLVGLWFTGCSVSDNPTQSGLIELTVTVDHFPQRSLVFTPTPSVTSIAPTGTFTPLPPSPTHSPTPHPTATPLLTTAEIFRLLSGTNYAAFQPFEHGAMFWFDRLDLIFVLYGQTAGEWEVYPDSFIEGGIETDPAIQAPPNRQQPRRGFGLVWRQHNGIQSNLGWAVRAEVGYSLVLTYNASRDTILFPDSTGRRYILYENGTWAQ